MQEITGNTFVHLSPKPPSSSSSSPQPQKSTQAVLGGFYEMRRCHRCWNCGQLGTVWKLGGKEGLAVFGQPDEVTSFCFLTTDLDVISAFPRKMVK